eukprot:m.18428 g.18428  ORF g.18428 m.18428 type:complete len:59 (-) comp30113_c0_seq1:78-254(-)
MPWHLRPKTLQLDPRFKELPVTCNFVTAAKLDALLKAAAEKHPLLFAKARCASSSTAP